MNIMDQSYSRVNLLSLLPVTELLNPIQRIMITLKTHNALI